MTGLPALLISMRVSFFRWGDKQSPRRPFFSSPSTSIASLSPGLCVALSLFSFGQESERGRSDSRAAKSHKAKNAAKQEEKRVEKRIKTRRELSFATAFFSSSSSFDPFLSLPLSLFLPQVDLVLLPAVTGDFGVMPGHVPTVAQLRPGVVAVHTELDKEVEKYFVSSGFAFVHADSSAEVCAVEAVKVSDLDPDAVRAGLADHTAKLAALQAKGDDYEIAAAQVGVEVFSAMSAAVGA